LGEDQAHSWLPLEEAAKRLQVSRLRLREGIAAGAIRAQRDNRGFWRITLAGGAESLRDRPRDATIDPAGLVELLFDEIEEINASLAERDAQVDRLSALLARHEALLERTLRLAESRSSRAADAERLERLATRSDALIERAIESLAKKDSDLSRMSGLMDRALSTAAGLDAETARQSELIRKHHALFERLLALAQASVDRIAGGGRAGGVLSRIRSRLSGGKTSGP
jgi:hypothetical protein